jgi:hypothetical protein
MDYLATHPDATIRYQASDMILAIHSDASYLSETELRSRAGSIAFLSSTGLSPKLNRAIHVHFSIMKMVLASAAKALVPFSSMHKRRAVYARSYLISATTNQPQPSKLTMHVPMASWILLSSNADQRSMHFYWLRDRIRQLKSQVYWEPGTNDIADYFTKHHQAKVHEQIRHQYFYPPVLGLSPKHTINGEALCFPHLSAFEHNNVTVVPTG